jgi:hypothetical protein
MAVFIGKTRLIDNSMLLLQYAGQPLRRLHRW